MPEIDGEIMLNLSEALLNLKEDYPGRNKANRSFGRLMSYLNFTPPKYIIVLDESTGLAKLTEEKKS